jgi:O-antigen/teichoic acid export membrane protein
LNTKKIISIKNIRNNPILNSSFWTVFGYGLSQLFRLIGNLILTKLLMPEMFGIMAIVNVLVTGVQMFSDIGLGPSIIQSKRGEEADFINTAWTLQILRGFAIWLFVSVVAVGLWFANRYGYINQDQVYGHPLLPWLLVVVGSSSVISGFNSTAIFVSNRTLALGRITVINLLSQVIGLCAIIYFAWLKQSIWALAVGTIVTSLVYMVLSHKFLPGAANKLCWDKTAVKDLIKFGKWIFLTTAIGFVANQGDRLLLGSYLTPEMLGVYSIAFMYFLIKLYSQVQVEFIETILSV